MTGIHPARRSTVCRIFCAGVINAFALDAIRDRDHPHPPLLRINAVLARAVNRRPS
jgi:hypothetical protein